MALADDDDRIVYMAEADVLAASGMCQALRNCWFSVHPERGLVFWQTDRRRKGRLTGAAPQCNSDESTSRALTERLYPWAEVKRFALVLLPIDLGDYQ